MDIKQLECFLKCAETGSFTRAADLLYLNQSNVSRMIRNLEEDLNTTLFIRSNKGIILTMDGENIYRKTKEIMVRLDRLAGTGERRKYDQYVIETFPSNYIAYAYSQLCEKYAGDNLILRFYSKGTSEILKDLEDNTADIGFIYSSEKQKAKLRHVLDKRKLVFHPVCQAVPVIYVGKQYHSDIPLEKRPDIWKKQRFFKVDTDYRENYHDLLETVHYYGLEGVLNHAEVVDNGYGINQMLNNTSCFYLGHAWVTKEGNEVPDAYHDKDVYRREIRLESMDGDIQIGYVVRKKETESPLVKELLGFLQDRFHNKNIIVGK